MQLTELRAFCGRSGWDVAEYIEKASGKAGAKRPVLDKLLSEARLRKFDVVIVWKLDRFGRSLSDFVGNVQILDQAGIRFIAPSQGIDTDNRTPVGKLLMHIMAAFAEFERSLIVERVRAGVQEAKRQGKHCGRPKRVFDRQQARDMKTSGLSVRAIASRLGVGKGTVQRLLAV